jgi:hypothetical protein
MLRNSLAAFVALALLAAGTGARALPPTDIPDLTGGIIEPPIDPCDLDPDLCVPDPEPPTSICDRFPALCVNEDPPVFEPPEEPLAPVLPLILGGTARIKGTGFRTSEPYGLRMNADPDAGTFLAMDEHGTLYSGHLVPKGTQGDKFKLFLDEPSSQAFGASVAATAATATGRSAGAVLGESSKLTLKVNEDGSLSLKIKSQLLVGGLGELAFKANLVEAQPDPL